MRPFLASPAESAFEDVFLLNAFNFVFMSSEYRGAAQAYQIHPPDFVIFHDLAIAAEDLDQQVKLAVHLSREGLDHLRCHCAPVF